LKANATSTDEDEEDFNEDNPYHVCKASRAALDLEIESEDYAVTAIGLMAPMSPQATPYMVDYGSISATRGEERSFGTIERKLESLECELENFKLRTA
jgi:hypothetical protein